jgi:hypothetical protein
MPHARPGPKAAPEKAPGLQLLDDLGGDLFVQTDHLRREDEAAAGEAVVVEDWADETLAADLWRLLLGR